MLWYLCILWNSHRNKSSFHLSTYAVAVLFLWCSLFRSTLLKTFNNVGLLLIVIPMLFFTLTWIMFCTWEFLLLNTLHPPLISALQLLVTTYAFPIFMGCFAFVSAHYACFVFALYSIYKWDDPVLYFLSMMIWRSIHVTANGITSFFLRTE